MKNQALFSSKDKSKNFKCHLLQFLFGALGLKSPSFRHKDLRPDPFGCSHIILENPFHAA